MFKCFFNVIINNKKEIINFIDVYVVWSIEKKIKLYVLYIL